MKLLSRAFMVCALFASVGGCGSKGGSSGGGSGGTPVPPPVGEVQTDGMSIGIVTDPKDLSNIQFKSAIYKSTGFADPCFIPSTLYSQDIVCYADFSELDLYFHGVSYHYNVPPKQCAYLAVSTSWAYNQEIGVGPTSIVYSVTLDAAGAVTASTCTTEEPGAGNPGPTTDCTNNPEVEFNTADGSFTCRYDRSASGGNNCCFGDYTLDQTVTRPTGSTRVVDLNRRWNGTLVPCMTPLFPNSWKTGVGGFPVTEIYYADKGINDLFTIDAPIQIWNVGANLMSATRYTPALHTHDGFYSARISTLPYAVDPIDDRNGTDLAAAGLPPGNLAYEFMCMDEAFEILNRIRVYSREWNTYSQFLTFLSTQGASGDPDIATAEPCEGVGIGQDCNDIADWDDIGNIFPNYPTNPATDLLDRRDYFPNLAR
ncbi:MAG: hypothetical protein ABL958_08260 [Bdellovibrionia bacterium]